MVAAFRMAIFVHRSVLLSNWDDLRAVFLGSGYMTHPITQLVSMASLSRQLVAETASVPMI